MRPKGVTMKDIAAAAGVSQTTVSLILNRKFDSFHAETIKKVMDTAKSMNYQFPHSLSQPDSNTVMVISVQTANPYYAAMLQGIDKAAFSQSINLLSVCTYHNPTLEATYLQLAIDQRLRGVIFLCLPDNMEAYENACASIPVVVVCDKDANVRGDIVELNHFDAGALAAKHLLELGHTHIAVMSHVIDGSTSSAKSRLNGILSEVQKGAPKENLLMLTSKSTWTNVLENPGFHYEVGYTLAQDKRLYQNNVTGIICVNDMMAYGAMDALRRKGYRIPEDFSIIGSDNLVFSQMAQVSLTTVEFYSSVIAQSALTTLLNRTSLADTSPMVYSAAQFRVQCQPSLLVRSSTGPARTAPFPDPTPI